MGALLSLVLAASTAVPALHQWVTDDAQALSSTQREALDAQLREVERATGHQLVVYLGRTTAGVPIEDWAVRAFKAWRVGRAGLDDGVALLIFVDDRTSRIEVGYGLEATLTDVQSARILREVLAPKMAAGDVDGAVSAAVTSITTVIGGGELAPAAWTAVDSAKVIAGLLAVLAFIALAIWKPQLAWALLWMMSGRRRGSGSGGGGFQGGGGRSGGGGASGRW